MSDWAKEFVADVARELDELYPEFPRIYEVLPVLERRFLPYLLAGQAMRDGNRSDVELSMYAAFKAWDAARADKRETRHE